VAVFNASGGRWRALVYHQDGSNNGEGALDLQTLHQRTGLSKRKLRYCIDHKLVPELAVDLAPNEVGRPRRFGEDIGFGIVCAALLLDLGLPHEQVRSLLKGLLDITMGKGREQQPALITVLTRPVAAVAEYGDGLYVRLKVPDCDYDSQWRTLDSHQSRPPQHYEPKLTVTLNLGRIRDEVYGEQ
jgi:hypothetical protein